MLTERDGKEIVVAKHGIVEATRSDPRINAILLIATIASTVLAGTILYAETSALGRQLLGRANDPIEALLIVLRTPALWIIGVPYALTLLTILGVHEMGHYVMAKRHKADVTLPYFIPMPFGLGTMGAVIRLKSPIKNRRQLFDIGVAGPLAGLAVAMPLLIIGLVDIAGGVRRAIGARRARGQFDFVRRAEVHHQGAMAARRRLRCHDQRHRVSGLVRPHRHDDQFAAHRPTRRRAHHLFAVRARAMESGRRRGDHPAGTGRVSGRHDGAVLERVAVVGDAGAGLRPAPPAAAG